jgi:hypothetical protein
MAGALLISSSLLFAEDLPRDQWGAPAVSVTSADGVWTIAGKKVKVILNASDLAMAVEAGPVRWEMAPSSTKDLLVRSKGEEFYLRLADAEKIEIAPYDTGFKTGVKLALSGWRHNGLRHRGAALDLTLYLTVALEGGDEELVFSVVADEHEAVVRQLDWPPALDAREVEFTVLSNFRGTLLPRDWPHPYSPIRTMTPEGKISPTDTSEVESNLIECWSMSWWGFQKGRAAMMVIVETPDDAAYRFEHPPGGPTVIGPRWRATLGRFGYPRSARMVFFSEGNYVDLAKRYRRHTMETGLFVSLNEKIARTPAVGNLIGIPLIRLHTLRNYKPDSARFDHDDPSKNFSVVTFDERARMLRELKSKGLDRLLVVLAGWPYLGYDRQHPDGLPPAPQAGGWEGLRRLAETARELGYLFSLHEQYRDYYIDAPSYDPQFAIHEEEIGKPPRAFPGTRFGSWRDGHLPFMNHWDGGVQTFLSPRFMLGHLVKNYGLFFDRGIRPQGVYLDVFGYVPPDEDFNPEHPATRTDAMKARARLFDWSRRHLGVVGTEAAADWVIPYVDFSSPLRPARGIPVPLFNLVYHDAILTPYRPDDLHGLLNGGMPQFSSLGEEESNQLSLIRRMAALHRRVALLEMTKHEFVDAGFRKERTTFADGTTVTVDWDANTVEVWPELSPGQKLKSEGAPSEQASRTRRDHVGQP